MAKCRIHARHHATPRRPRPVANPPPARSDRSQTEKPANRPLRPRALPQIPRICSPQSTRPESPPPTPTSTRRRPDDLRTRARACDIIHPGTHQTQPSADNDQTYPNKQPARHPTPTITEDQTKTEPQNPATNDHPIQQPTENSEAIQFQTFALKSPLYAAYPSTE